MVNSGATRRRFLATVSSAVLVGVAGCTGTPATGKADTDGEQSLLLRLTPQTGTLRERYVVDLAERFPERDVEAFQTTIAGSTYTTTHRKPFAATAKDPTYTEHEGTYYQLSAVAVDEVTETHPVVRLYEATTDSESAPDAVAADRLPEPDQRAIHIAYLAARARGSEAGVPWGLVQRGGYVYRQSDAIERSELLTEDAPSQVTYRDRRYDVEISRERFHEPVYRATVEPVANSPEQMESILRATVIDAHVSRDELSEAAQNILGEAQGDGYSERHPYSSAYRTVLKALQRRAYLDGDIENDAWDREQSRGLLRYGEEYFTYQLRFTSNADQ